MDKEMMLSAVDIIRSVSEHQKGFRRALGRILNRISYVYYRIL